ncbi:MAG: tRNA pseudouridine(55) synthase TruB [Acidobacteriota bacterium]
MDGLLVIDKPAGPTSHDVVARVRRAIRERRIGHTGTLDPAATGLLPLVVGRATRLARFLSASDKSYEAVIRLGVSTDTRDAEGEPVGPAFAGSWPAYDVVNRALDAFRGSFLQQPPAYSAKKIDGQRAYALARAEKRRAAAPADAAVAVDAGAAARAPLPDPVRVTAYRIDLTGGERDQVVLSIDCSAGFYVRSLAHDLGERLGTGAHLLRLRRTRSGDLTLDQAVALDALERNPSLAPGALVPMADMLPGLPAAHLTTDGVRRAVQGQDIGPADLVGGCMPREAPWARLVGPGGLLVAVAAPGTVPGVLHPSVVLV